ncbi:MAG TPA: 50S ribosomal protein L11 methyltransferase [Solirubrobacteraceae bacterium]|nr:50S ribosomal protein L11 methyltransferase [Solirubrobacteraceae bacterium]
MIRLALRVRRADAEVVLAELLELAPNGVEETDEGDVVEYAVYGAPGELPALPALEAAAGGALVEIATTEVSDDWFDGWKRFHAPVLVGERLHVRPPWTEPLGAPGVDEIVIDPGQAFGTGAHATTRMCLELLLELEPGGSFADLGCGSGVLAIAAAKLGWEPVAAFDHEAAAVDAARENAAVNGVAVEVARADLRREPLPRADTVAANLLRPLLLAVAERLREPAVAPGHRGASSPPGALVAGGLLRAEAGEAAAAFAAAGLREAQRRESGDWAALLLVCDDRRG